mgnify:CR=1 FL=1
MKAPRELYMASGAALLRMLDCKDKCTRDAAEREYGHIQNQIAKIEGLREFMPLGGDASNLIRGR